MRPSEHVHVKSSPRSTSAGIGQDSKRRGARPPCVDLRFKPPSDPSEVACACELEGRQPATIAHKHSIACWERGDQGRRDLLVTLLTCLMQRCRCRRAPPPIGRRAVSQEARDNGAVSSRTRVPK